MSKEYLSIRRDLVSRVFQTFDKFQESLNLDVFQNFLDVLQNSDKALKKQVFTELLSELSQLNDGNASKQEIADITYFVGYKVRNYSKNYQDYFCNKAFDLYKEIQDYQGMLVSGGESFFLSMMSEGYTDETTCKRSFEIIKLCLGEIEKKEGKGDHYCYFINSSGVLGYLCKKECQQYLQDFLTDYSPQDEEVGKILYDELAQAIRVMYNEHRSITDPEHSLWVDNYIKYQSLSILLREKTGKAACDYGKLWLGVFYSIEYENSGNEDYYEKSKQILSSIKSNSYYHIAQGHLNDLETIKMKK